MSLNSLTCLIFFGLRASCLATQQMKPRSVCHWLFSWLIASMLKWKSCQKRNVLGSCLIQKHRWSKGSLKLIMACYYTVSFYSVEQVYKLLLDSFLWTQSVYKIVDSVPKTSPLSPSLSCLLQVTVEYRDNRGSMEPLRVHTVVISVQHTPDVSVQEIRQQLLEKVVKAVVPARYLDDRTIYHLLPSGKFLEGGPRVCTNCPQR